MNLANGNLALQASIRRQCKHSAVRWGMSFSYNSQADPNGNKGLAATYYNALNQGADVHRQLHVSTGREPVLAQTGAVGPLHTARADRAGACPADYFMGKWAGFITPPTCWDLHLRRRAQRRSPVTVGLVGYDDRQIDQWTTTGVPDATNWERERLLPTTPTPITRGVSTTRLATPASSCCVKGPGITDVDGIPVPANWFTKQVRYLPGGWASCGSDQRRRRLLPPSPPRRALR